MLDFHVQEKKKKKIKSTFAMQSTRHILTACECLLSAPSVQFKLSANQEAISQLGVLLNANASEKGGRPPVCICPRKLLALLIAHQEALKRCHEKVTNCITISFKEETASMTLPSSFTHHTVETPLTQKPFNVKNIRKS